MINGTEASLAKHDGGTDGNSEAPYSADALARLVREAVRRIAGDLLREGALSGSAAVRSAGQAIVICGGLLMKRASRTAVRETTESRPDILSALS